MLRKCTAEDEMILKKYLEQEQEYNTFLLADIAAYGFENQCQDVWMEWEENTCKGIYLRFYTNLLVYSKDDGLQRSSIQTILKSFPVFVIMGKSSALKDISEFLAEHYCCVEKQLYKLGTTEKLYTIEETAGQSGVLQAEESDVDDIFHFLGKIPEIRALYTSKEMIRDRIVSGDGVHLFICEDGQIISHGNSTTEAEKTAMIGGLATEEEHRRKGYASKVLSALCRYILARGKTPCLFSDCRLQALFEKLGFECLGGWSTLERI